MRIAESALKHGITPEQIRQGLQVPMSVVTQQHRAPSKELVIGADRSGQLLELVVVDRDGDDPRVIHAMRLRPKFYRYL
ncbi:hypothetical protein [Isoptericola sp. NPDC019571]|uniref:hypothetical protein n=1 Tax=Isoptericola sp. NPDC019571 TaxID=3364008 RepID=UPI0037899C6C